MESNESIGVRRYEILDEVPRTLRAVRRNLNKAKGRRLGDRERERLIIGAGEQAYETLVDFTRAAPLWMALQRQVLVRRWRLEDLRQLNKLTVPVTARLLVALTVQPERQADRNRSQALAEDLVNDAKDKLEEVQKAARAAATADGLTAPSVEVLLVDHAHIEVEKLRRRLGALLAAAQHGQDKEADLERIVKRCAPVLAVIAFLATAALQIPEVQDEVVRVGSDLKQIIGQITEAVRAQVGTLGVLAAARFAAGPDDGLPVHRGPRPDSPGPSGEPHVHPKGILAEFMTIGLDDQKATAAEGEQAASTVEAEAPSEQMVLPSDGPTGASQLPPDNVLRAPEQAPFDFDARAEITGPPIPGADALRQPDEVGNDLEQAIPAHFRDLPSRVVPKGTPGTPERPGQSMVTPPGPAESVRQADPDLLQDLEEAVEHAKVRPQPPPDQTPRPSAGL